MVSQPLKKTVICLFALWLCACQSNKPNPLPIQLDRQGVIGEQTIDTTDDGFDFFLLEDWF